MSPYGDAVALYNSLALRRAPGDSRLFVSEFFDSGRVMGDGSTAGGTFVYNTPYGKARDKARSRSKWVQRDEVNELTLLEAIQSRSISPTLDDAKYYLNHHVSHLSMYISATHHVKQSMPHGLPSTSAGMSETLNKMEHGPVEVLEHLFASHQCDAPESALLFERQEVQPAPCLRRALFL